jgi:putative tricarboxylic transport membrane protein
MRIWAKQAITLWMLALATTPAFSIECIVPSKPGGGFDLTCKLVQKGMQAELSAADKIRISYMPGGIGAVAWNAVTTQRRAESETLIASSSGSLLNIALGKFGRASAADSRWVAGVATDYGMIAVRSDAPYKNLRELVEALRHEPAKMAIGAGGTIGSQDWFKMALIAKQGSVDLKGLRFVALEGGGESFTALLAGHIQVVSGDASEAALYVPGGKIRVLAVLSDARLPGVLSNVPTAREQGYEVSWPIIRGFYMGPQVSDADYHKWVARFDRMLASPAFNAQCAEYSMYPFAMTGAQFTDYVKKSVDNYGKLAKELGLVR